MTLPSYSDESNHINRKLSGGKKCGTTEATRTTVTLREGKLKSSEEKTHIIHPSRKFFMSLTMDSFC